MTMAWLIGNKKYDEVRNAGHPKILDLDQVPLDIKNMTNFFQKICFDKVIITEDANEGQVAKVYNEIREILKAANKSTDTEVLLYTYYSGHGVMDTTTKIVLNESAEQDRYFALEQKL